MAASAKEKTKKKEESSEPKDPFMELVRLCISSYGVTYSDSTALDANGVIGKQRIMVLENETYQRETRRLKAQRTIDDLKEVNSIQELLTLDYMDDEEEGDEDDEFAVKNKKDKKPKPLFDKAKTEMRLKLLQQRRDIMNAASEDEEKESEALNIFFISVTPEEFAALETVEVSEATSHGKEAFKNEEEAPKKAREKKKVQDVVHPSDFHYEMIDGEQVAVAN